MTRSLRDAGVRRFVLVSADPEDLKTIAPDFDVVARTDDPRIMVVGAR